MIDPKALEAVYRSLADLKQDRQAEEATIYERSRGNRTVDPKDLDDTIASQVKPEPVDLGNVVARPTPEQIADAMKDPKKKKI